MTPPRAPLLIAALLLTLSATPAVAEDTSAFACGTTTPRGCDTWTTRFAAEGGSVQPFKLVQSPDGSTLFVTALAYNATLGGQESTLRAYRATGDLLWQFSIVDGTNATVPAGIAITPDGRTIYLSLSVTEFSGAVHGIVLSIDAITGTPRWSAVFDDKMPYLLVLSPDGETLYLVGTSYRSLLLVDLLAMALDADDGSVLWTATYDGAGQWTPETGSVGWDAPSAAALTLDGSRLLMTGSSANATLEVTDTLTIAFDTTTGEKLWDARLAGFRSDSTAASSWAHAIGLSPSGETTYVLGTEGLRAYDTATGTLLWRPSMQDNSCELHDYRACDLEIHPMGVAVYTRSDHAIAAYDARTGALLWNVPTSVFIGELTDAQLTMHPDGGTLYTHARAPKLKASMTVPDQRAAAVEAYDTSTGTLVWRVLHEEGEYTYPIDVLASPDGSQVAALALYEPYDDPAQRIALIAYPTNIGLRADDSPLRPMI